jgi:hypothetical protein
MKPPGTKDEALGQPWLADFLGPCRNSVLRECVRVGNASISATCSSFGWAERQRRLYLAGCVAE